MSALKKFHEDIQLYVKYIERFTDRFWYAPLLALLAFIDNYVLIVPTDGILISSVLLQPKRWLLFSLCIAGGSSIGAWGIAELVQLKGLPWILNMYSGLDQTSTWIWTQKFFTEYGLFLVFGIAMTPLMQQPAVIIASLAGVPSYKIFLVSLAGRTIKYLIMGYIATHAPRLLSKMWGVQGELKDSGVKIDQ